MTSHTYTAWHESLLADDCFGSRDLLEVDQEFRRWFETEYIPIAGGWQY